MINNGDIVFDCGANFGVFSIMAANFNCTCYAFEPLPANISNLKELVKVNPHIVIAPYAVCERNGTAIFESSDEPSMSTKISSDDFSGIGIEVDCITLDTFVDKNNIKHVDFIKADIEGAERLMLKGAQGILKEFAPKLSICTYHLPDDPEVLRDLVSNANPNYVITEKYKRLYAHVPQRD